MGVGAATVYFLEAFLVILQSILTTLLTTILLLRGHFCFIQGLGQSPF